VSEAHEYRLDRLEQDMRDIKGALARLEPMIVAIHAQLPHLATKAELERKPDKGFLVGAVALLLAAYAAGLAGLAALPVIAKLVQ
jgi:hypothetical protein